MNTWLYALGRSFVTSRKLLELRQLQECHATKSHETQVGAGKAISTQGAQYSLIKEYTLNVIGIPEMISGADLN